MQMAQTIGRISLLLAVASWVTPASGLSPRKALRATARSVGGEETHGVTISAPSTESHSNSSSEDPRVVFVHIPKTAGTSFDEALRVLHSESGVSVRICGFQADPMARCLHTAKQPILSGEFVARTFLDATAGRHDIRLPTAAWTFLRNPMLRTLSELGHLRDIHVMEDSEIPEFFHAEAAGSCPFGDEFCRNLFNPEKCMGDPCNIFQNHQTRVLGYAGRGEDTTADLQRAEERLINGSIRVMVTEYYAASICLFLHDNRGIEGIAPMFERCCLETSADGDGAEGCPILDKSNMGLVKHNESDYWDTYLSDPMIRATTLAGVQEDCELYQVGLEIFQSQVRAVERDWNVTLLPSEDIASWSCDSWLSQYVRTYTSKDSSSGGSAKANYASHVIPVASPEDFGLVLSGAGAVPHQKAALIAKRGDAGQSVIG